jgi:hypothetical protein
VQKYTKFSNEGNAAITQNCPLGVRLLLYFFLSNLDVLYGVRVSPKQDNGTAVFLLCGLQVVFVRWLVCRNTTFKRGKATVWI